MFKAHSARGVACSSAAWSGVTGTDIPKAAEWSAKTTFLQFNHQNKQDSFWAAVLSSAGTSNVHVDMETAPSQKFNLRMAQDTQCLHAIGNYTRKVKLKYQNILSLPPQFSSL